MSGRPENCREFISEFIELYKSLPCLWNIKSHQYRDRALKNEGYAVLLEKYREIDPMASKETVKAKINALRTTYRKVLGRLNQSIQSSSNDDELYRPSLWYFHLFDFLRHLEPQVAEKNKHGSHSQPKIEEEYDEYTQASDEKYYSPDIFANASPSPSVLDPEHHYISSSSHRASLSSRKRRAVQQFNTSRENMVALQASSEEDPYDLYGRHIANKLRSLTAQQNVFAQKLINDVLFEAEMESLSRTCKVVTENQQ